MRSALRVLAYSIALLVCPGQVSRLGASPLPPNIWASASRNGRFLVAREQELGPVDHKGGRKILGTTFRVFAPDPEINAKDRLSANLTLWSDPQWEITLDKPHAALSFWPMLSTDGETLILLRVTPPASAEAVLQIYHRIGSAGRLVRSVSLTDLWTARQIDPAGKGIIVFTDATPQWFAGGVLSFARDGRHLLYRTQWSDRLQINLSNGSVRRLPKEHLGLTHASKRASQHL